MKKPKTYGELLDLLKLCAEATKMGDKGEVIKGNKKLELRRAKDVKNLEDMLVDVTKKEFEMTYIRQYEYLYKKKRKDE